MCFVIGMYMCLATSKGKPISRCIDPINATNQFIDMNNGFNDTQYLFEGMTTHQDSNEGVIDIAYTNVFGNNTSVCPKTLKRGDHPLRVRSTCPWYISIDYDSTRIPSTIPLAVSSCKFCVGSNRTKKCEPIRHNITVLRQIHDCGNGLYKYVTDEMRITVAYICAVPKEVESSGIINNNTEDGILNLDDPIPIA